MDIRKWLNGPKGLKTEPKSPKLVQKKKSALDSSDEEEIVTVIKPKILAKSENKENKGTNPADFFSPSKPKKEKSVK